VRGVVSADGQGVKIVRSTEGETRSIEVSGARGLTETLLLDYDDGPGNFDLGYVTLEPGGVSADHEHPWEQANFVLAGEGSVFAGGETHEVRAQDFVFTPPNVRHYFTNGGDEEFVLLCMRGRRSET